MTPDESGGVFDRMPDRARLRRHPDLPQAPLHRHRWRQLAAEQPDVVIVGAPFDMADDEPARRPLRPARHPRRLQPGPRHPPPRARRAAAAHTCASSTTATPSIIPSDIERSHEAIRAKVAEVAATGAIPIVLGGDHSITLPAATAVADAVGRGKVGIVHFDAHADTAPDNWGVLARPRHAYAPPDRERRRARPQLRPGRPARLLAAAGRRRLDARAGHALAPHGRDRAARLRRRPRAGDRRGAGRPGGASTSPSTSTCSTRPSRPAPARPSPAASRRASCSAPCAASRCRRDSPAWTSSRSRLPTTPAHHGRGRPPRRPRGAERARFEGEGETRMSGGPPEVRGGPPVTGWASVARAKARQARSGANAAKAFLRSQEGLREHGTDPATPRRPSRGKERACRRCSQCVRRLGRVTLGSLGVGL